MYRGNAPTFITTSLDYLEAMSRNAAVDPSRGRPYSAEAFMLVRRLKVYPPMRRIAESPATCCCARCFASLLLNQARAWVRTLVRFPGFACFHNERLFSCVLRVL